MGFVAPANFASGGASKNHFNNTRYQGYDPKHTTKVASSLPESVPLPRSPHPKLHQKKPADIFKLDDSEEEEAFEEYNLLTSESKPEHHSSHHYRDLITGAQRNIIDFAVGDDDEEDKRSAYADQDDPPDDNASPGLEVPPIYRANTLVPK